jgi:hypothetical protein
MFGNLYQNFGQELAAQRRTQFELQARHHHLVRTLKRARKVDRVAAAERTAHRAPQQCCAADLG